MTTSPAAAADGSRELLRHALATLAYRGAKAVRGAPDEFAMFRVGDRSRTPAAIVAHIGDLLEWALSSARGQEVWNRAKPLPWPQEVERFFGALAALDDYLASGAPLETNAERLFQGPVADALTHVGQLTMLRRLAGAPVRGENYVQADIRAGRVGSAQTAPGYEFD